VSGGCPSRPDIAPDMVRRWDLARETETVGCPFVAASKLHDGPDIFFNLSDDLRNVDGGSWIVTRADLQREVLQKSELFSSRGISGFSAILGESWPLMPVELDAPDHMRYRKLINPLFSPRRMDEIEAGVRESAIELIEAVRHRGGCEFMTAYARELPVNVFLRLMGLPLAEVDTFRKWEDEMMHSDDVAVRAGAAHALKAYLLDIIGRRRAEPTDDLISHLVTATLDDRPLDDDAVLGLCFFLYIAGLDTVAATLSFIFATLAEQPDLQNRLRSTPTEIPEAVEELIRAFGTVVTSRYLTEDTVFHGVAMRKGDRVITPLGVASRDPAEYEDANTLNIDRLSTRNISFGAGPHRCIGSHLARREITLTLEEWLARIPEFRLAPNGKPVPNVVTVWGHDTLQLEW